MTVLTAGEAAPANWPWGDLKPGAYDVVVIDPPWRYMVRSARGLRKSAQAHYQCRDLDWIKALPVRELLSPVATVFVWTTWPMLASGAAHEAVRAWGLAPVTGGSWAKRTRSGRLRMGPGYVVRTGAELQLIAVDEASDPYLVARGHRGQRLPSFVNHTDGLAREHSRKPDEFYRQLLSATPWARRCDLFARARHEGFESWGDEVGRY